MRCLPGVLVALLLSGCGTRDPYVTNDGLTKVGDWQIASQVDRVTGATLPSATVLASSSTSFVDEPLAASLQLTCFEGRPIVRLAFLFKLGPDRNAMLGYRFDDRPGRDNVPSRILAGQQIVVIEEPAAVAQFHTDMQGAAKVYIRVRSLSTARTSAEFPLRRSEDAIAAAYSQCPIQAMPAPQPPPRRVS